MWYTTIPFIKPTSLKEALDLLSQTAAQPIAGGTDLLVQVRTNRDRVQAYLRIDHLDELKKLEFSNDQLTIGAGVTYTDYLTKASGFLPPLTEAVALIASPSIRNTATFGGNIINASPAADTLPIFYALDAVVMLESVGGVRRIPIHDFITGPKKTILRPDELLTEIWMDIPQKYTFSYRKIGPRKALSLSKVAFLGLHLPDANEIRLAYGAVGPTVIRAYEAEELFRNRKIDDIPACIECTVRPITDQRSTAEYRKYLCVALTQEFLSI